MLMTRSLFEKHVSQSRISSSSFSPGDVLINSYNETYLLISVEDDDNSDLMFMSDESQYLNVTYISNGLIKSRTFDKGAYYRYVHIKHDKNRLI